MKMMKVRSITLQKVFQFSWFWNDRFWVDGETVSEQVNVVQDEEEEDDDIGYTGQDAVVSVLYWNLEF